MLGRQFVERGGDAWVVILVTKFFHEVRGLWIQVVDQMPLVGGLRTEVVLNFDKNLVVFVKHELTECFDFVVGEVDPGGAPGSGKPGGEHATIHLPVTHHLR